MPPSRPQFPRCVRDPLGWFAGVLTYALIGFADYVAIFVIILPHFYYTFAGFINILAFNALLGLALFSHYKAMTSDPGIVPPPLVELDFSSVNSSNDGSNPPIWTLCSKCANYRPPLAHHCSTCGYCVRKMDHHCPWINNCVGEFNMKYFLLFLFYVGLSCVYSTGLLIAALVWSRQEQEPDIGESKSKDRVLLIILAAETGLFLLFVTFMSRMTLGMALRDSTKIEAMISNRNKAAGASGSLAGLGQNGSIGSGGSSGGSLAGSGSDSGLRRKVKMDDLFGAPFTWRWFSPLHASHPVPSGGYSKLLTV